MTSASDYAWVSSLAKRYELATRELDKADTRLLTQLPSLQFATAVLEKIALDRQWPNRASHIVIIGPTQSGKSTLANVLLDSRAASVSALAGFTVHSQGYAPNITDNDIRYVDKLMAPLQRISGDMLDSANLESYVLESVSTGGSPLLDDAVIWDTPDFDSITAASYSLAVVRAAALADSIVLTVSKDKYGDKRVWDMLHLFKAMGKPLLVCINKVSDADRDVITQAFTERFEQVFGLPLPEIVMLPFVEHADTQSSLPLDNTTRQSLQNAVRQVQNLTDSALALDHCEHFIISHEAHWLAPLVTEMESREQWLKLTQDAIDAADDYYVEHYLDSPDKYETFNRALAELLTFLEIPGIASTLTKTRKAITWPARQLLGVGRSMLGKPSDPALAANGQKLHHQALVLQHILDSTLIRMQRELLEPPGDSWRQALDSRLRNELPSIRQSFSQASEQAEKDFEPEIEKAAARLYEQLRQQPALLNTLRAARASADAAGIALAVKSGGLAPTDLIFAPAMLSVTTLLTESALGRYLDSVKRELKERQRQHTREQVFEAILQTRFLGLMEQLNKPELLTNALEPELTARLDTYRQATAAHSE